MDVEYPAFNANAPARRKGRPIHNFAVAKPMPPVDRRGPDYANPPVVETILGVQFDHLPAFTNAHLGAFWRSLSRQEWPSPSDAPPLNDQFEQFTDSARWATAGVQFQVTQAIASRIQIRSTHADRMIQVQNGRLHFNWLAVAGGPYPRYETIRGEFVAIFEQFANFLATEELGELRANQWEVTYLNHIPKGTVWQSAGDWDFFQLLGPDPSLDGLIEAESFGGEWHFVIPGQLGRLHTRWQHAQTSPSKGEGQEVIRLTLTARGPVESNSDAREATLKGLDLGHTTIVCSFEQFMTAAANRYWGLRNAESGE